MPKGGLVEPPKAQGWLVEQRLKNEDECSLPQSTSKNYFFSEKKLDVG